MNRQTLFTVGKGIIIILILLAVVFALKTPAADLGSLDADGKALYTDASGLPYFSEMDSYYNFRLTDNYVDHGYEKNYVYGPLHGTGIIEVEAPWCETSSQYYLKPNMCYQVDTYISADTFGVRWEKGIVVKENGFEMLSPEIPELCPEKLF